MHMATVKHRTKIHREIHPHSSSIWSPTKSHSFTFLLNIETRHHLPPQARVKYSKPPLSNGFKFLLAPLGPFSDYKIFILEKLTIISEPTLVLRHITTRQCVQGLVTTQLQYVPYRTLSIINASCIKNHPNTA